MMRYFPQDGVAVMSVFGPVTFGPCPVLVLKKDSFGNCFFYYLLNCTTYNVKTTLILMGKKRDGTHHNKYKMDNTRSQIFRTKCSSSGQKIRKGTERHIQTDLRLHEIEMIQICVLLNPLKYFCKAYFAKK